MRRFHQIVLIGSLLPLSWLAMMVVHEFGHVLGAGLTGGTVAKVVAHPLTISRTELSDNPHPLVVSWAGPAGGVLLPLTALGLARLFRMPGNYLIQRWFRWHVSARTLPRHSVRCPSEKGFTPPRKEKPMSRTLLQVLTIAVCIQVFAPLRADEPQTDRDKAVTLVKKLGGRVEVDEKAKDAPIVAVQLSDTKVSDADLEALKPLTQLYRLCLQNTTITDAGLEHLKGLAELHTLSLNHTKVTDAGLANLKGLSKLKTLSLANTRVTNKGLDLKQAKAPGSDRGGRVISR